MLRFLLYIFLVYLVYQFVVNFLIPVYKTTQKIRDGFREMNNTMNGANSQQQNSSSERTPSGSNSSKNEMGEYIDFEEIK